MFQIISVVEGKTSSSSGYQETRPQTYHSWLPKPREALYKHSGIYLPAVHAKASPWMCTKVLHEFRSHGQCTYGGCHQPCPVHRLFVSQKANGFNLAIQSDQLIQSWSCVNITRHKQYCTLPSDVPPPLPQ